MPQFRCAQVRRVQIRGLVTRLPRKPEAFKLFTLATANHTKPLKWGKSNRQLFSSLRHIVSGIIPKIFATNFYR